MQVLSLRGSNLIEVMDAQGKISLALFPAKFQKSMWIKRGSFVVVDDSGKEKALESGSKVTCIVSKVLFYEQLRALQKSPEWPEVFKSSNRQFWTILMEAWIERHPNKKMNQVTTMDFLRSKPIETESDHMNYIPSQIPVLIPIQILEQFQRSFMLSFSTLIIIHICGYSFVRMM